MARSLAVHCCLVDAEGVHRCRAKQAFWLQPVAGFRAFGLSLAAYMAA